MSGPPRLGITAMIAYVTITAVGVAGLLATFPDEGFELTGAGLVAWWLAYAVYAVTFVLSSLEPHALAGREPVLVGVLVVSGAVAWLVAADTGFTAILFVVTAAAAAMDLSPRTAWAVAAVQTVLVAVASAVVSPAPFAVVATFAYGTFMAFAVVVVTEQRRAVRVQRELATAHSELRAASVLLESSTRTAERLRIARDLHDALGHQLTALTLELEVASHQRPDAHEHVLRARSIAKDLLADVRRVVGETRSTPPDIAGALAALVSDIPGLDVDLRIDERRPIGDAEGEVVLRCVQEVVTNAIRHSGADRLSVTVVSDVDGVTLDACDNGSGVAAVRPGIGLTGLRERIEQRGGRLEVDSALGVGFNVHATVPS